VKNEKEMVGAKMIEVEVIKVAMDLEFKTPMILLKEKKGNKKLPIWMELFKARSIALAMEMEIWINKDIP